MRRRTVLQVLGGAVAVWPLVARAQSSKVHTILWVSTEAQPDPFIESFREGMRERGYIEGQNLTFVLRYAPGDPAALRGMLPEVLALPADLIVSSGLAIQGVRTATAKPILFAVSGDPVALGIADSLARPGRNFTGITFMSADVAQKRVEIVKELVPHLQTLAVLSNTAHPGEQIEYAATKEATEVLSMRLAYLPFAGGSEIDAALERVPGLTPDAMLVFPGGGTRAHIRKIVDFVRAHRLPSMFGSREYCDAGGLASYGANQRATYVRLAGYADRLLRGEKPSNLPIEQPTAFELVLNVRTARGLGFEIPPTLLARADHLID
jgi:putative ABC transport system substrate-binding protein